MNKKLLILALAVSSTMSAAYVVHAQGADITPPSVPTGITTSINTSNQIVVSWNASTDDTGVVGYYLYRNGMLIVNTPGVTTYTDTAPAGFYYYSVSAYDAAGNVSLQSAASPYVTVTTDTTPPTTPGSLSASIDASSTSITISWDASTDNVGVAGYNIYRNGYKLNSGSVTASPFVDSSTLISGYTYTYSISAFDAAGNFSNTAGIRVKFDITPPSTPAGLHASTISSDYITLAWQTSTDDTGLAGYYLYRDGTQIANISGTSYTDTGLSTSTSYTYAVVAYDAAGNLAPQTAVTVKTLAAAPIGSYVSPPSNSSSITLPAPPAPPSAPGDQGASGTGTGTGIVLSSNLYFGLRTNDVKSLQVFLISHGYLGAAYGTGFYGSLTLAAVKKFQCAQNIICTGSPWTTGWGSIGPRTRRALAAL